MNVELEIVNDWFRANLLSLNISKTSYIIFGNKKFNNVNLFINNTALDRQYDTKFLGVILSSNLKWNKHVAVVSNKFSKNLGIISKIRHILPRHITRSLYSTLAEPYISYCNLVWAQPNKTELLNTILKIQKKYIRLITFFRLQSSFQTAFHRFEHLVYL